MNPLPNARPAREPLDETEASDLRLLLETLHERSGQDFRDYAFSSLRRRIARVVEETKTGSISGLHQLLRTDNRALALTVSTLTIHTTAMFRDPDFFLLLRESVVPILRTYPFIRLWVAGCSSGEEVYSLSILLHEEGIADRCRIYATDLSESILERARSGVFPISVMKEYTTNYLRAGGKATLSDYYTADSDWVVLRRSLRDNVVFGTHNLVSDSSFNEFHLILCRNVLIYFRRELQERVHRLFHESLVTFGFLGLGRAETVRFTTLHDSYVALDSRQKLFRKVR